MIAIHILSAIALTGVVCRLRDINPHAQTIKTKIQHQFWVLANVLIGLGLLTQLFGLQKESTGLLVGGLALYHGISWHRRSTDK